MGDRGLGSRSINSSMMIQKVVIILLGVTVLCLVFYIIASSNNYFGEYVPSLSMGLSSPIYNMIGASSWGDQDDLVQVEYNELSKVLKAASTEDKTVILVTLNGAWAEPNSVFDVFLESFRVGNNTARLLKHLLVIAVDEKAYSRCQQTVSHCYFLKSNQTGEMAHEAKFMSPVYIELMWKRLAFLRIILTYGYNFVQTDTDVVWFRDPFPHFNDLDFQTSCDRFNGKPHDLKNPPNNGFAFVRSNKRTIAFYKFWISSRFKYPKLHEQDTFDKIKYDPIVKKIGLKLRFLDTVYFGGFCELSKDFNKVCTMHANCCTGLQRKVDDLNTALENWKLYLYLSVHQKAASQHLHWTVPHNCHM